MSNTSKGRATKGSKLMIQLAASPLQKHIIDEKLGEELVWLSPIEDTDYKEYQMSETEVCNFLGLDNKKDNFLFWPRRQPQWDGIAIGKKSATLYIFEAKSHLQETRTDCSATSKESKELIFRTITSIAKNVYNVTDQEVIESQWMRTNYQLANRLVFLQKMKELANYARFYEKVNLVLLNFVNDPTWDIEERVPNAAIWKEHYNNIFMSMKITKELLEKEGVKEIEYSALFVQE